VWKIRYIFAPVIVCVLMSEHSPNRRMTTEKRRVKSSDEGQLVPKLQANNAVPLAA
jgi:hypothetical protein